MKVTDRNGQTIRMTSATVATVGFFDGVHRGHQYLIQQVAEEARRRGLASLLVTFPQHPAQVLRPDAAKPLLTTADEKRERLAMSGADYVAMLPFTAELARLSAREFMADVLLQQLHVQVLLVGYDHRFGRNRSEGFDDYVRIGRELGIEVKAADALLLASSAVSSSLVRSHLLAGDVEKANEWLGYDYFLDGHVVDGFHVGRTIGYPTANVQPDCAAKLVPHDGAYAVRVTLADGSEVVGMLNIGCRPTLDNGTARSIEVHLLDFHADLYAQRIRVHFLRFLRPEQRFASVEALRQQLEADERAVRAMGGCGR